VWYWLCRDICLVVCYLSLRIRVSGRENIPRKGGFILVSNHASNLDPVLLGIVLPRRLDYLAKEELFTSSFFGSLLRSVGSVPLKRGSADVGALKESLRRLNEGRGLVMFPGGTRLGDGTLSRAQAGVGFLAAKSGVPVIPALIKGSDAAMPKGAKRIKRAVVSISFGKQIFIERRMPYQQIADEIMQVIRHLSC